MLGLFWKRSATLALVLALASTAVVTSLLGAKASTRGPLLAVGLVLRTSVLSLPILRIPLLHGLLRRCVRYRTWNIIGAFVDIEILVYRWRDWLNLRPQLLLNLIQVEAIIPVDQVDC